MMIRTSILISVVVTTGACVAALRTDLMPESKWITAMSGQGCYHPPLRLSKEFVVEKPVTNATLRATALGAKAVTRELPNVAKLAEQEKGLRRIARC